MPVLGVGTDIVKLARLEKIHAERGQRFAKRILTSAELLEFQDSKRQANFLAKRFAAKEAIVKALGTGFTQGIGFKDIEVYRQVNGRPCVRLFGAANHKLETLGASTVHLSLSDDAGLVLAFVVISD